MRTSDLACILQVHFCNKRMRMPFISFVFLMGLMGLSLSTAAQVQPALPLVPGFEDEIYPEWRQRLTDYLNTALLLVQRFPPEGYENNLFHWSADRAILANKSIEIIWATSQTQVLVPVLASQPSNTDALTMAVLTKEKMPTKEKETEKEKEKMLILLVLLFDRIFYDPAGNERRDGFSRLIVTLAHEIYGSVQPLLEFKMAEARPQTVADRVDQARRSYRASIMFLGGLIRNSQFASLPKNLQEGLLNLLPDAIRGYRSWQNATKSGDLDPGGEAMLKSLESSIPDDKKH
jgi:hypothetical protein